MGFAKLAIGVVLIGVLAFAFVTAFSMAAEDKSPDAFYNNNSNTHRAIQTVETVSGTTANLFTPLVIIGGITCLGAAFLVFRRVG
jgi:hypothetical protein